MDRTDARPEGSAVVVIAGAPGSGKGTQCERLAQRLGLTHVSPGGLLRGHIEQGSAIGREVRRAMDAGHLVADDVASEVVWDALDALDGSATVLLDGFPRTLPQAEALEARHPGVVKMTVELVVPTVVLTRRLRLRGRTDDADDAVRQRLAAYAREREPLRQWFAARGLLVHIDGNQPPDLVTSALAEQLARVGIRSTSEDPCALPIS